jgi:Flp pilus assembly protein TadD
MKRFGAFGAICGAAAVLAASAHADAYDDASAGLNALNDNDYDHAVSLFTRAISLEQLSGDQLEYAYACRGRAYLKKGDLSHAIVDLDRARRMKPDDSDAQNDLVTALQTELPPAQIPGRPKPNPWKDVGNQLLQDVVVPAIVNGLAGTNQ